MLMQIIKYVDVYCIPFTRVFDCKVSSFFYVDVCMYGTSQPQFKCCMSVTCMLAL